MNRSRFAAFIASAFVLYIVASAGAASLSFDVSQLVVLLSAFALALTPAFAVRGEPEEAPGRVAMLGAALSIVLASWAARALHSLAGELLSAVLLPFAGLLVLELAVLAPDVPPRLMRRVRSLGFVRLLGASAAIVGAVSVLPPLAVASRALILPFWATRAPWAFALSALSVALLVRGLRRRLGSDARALAMNLWALVGTQISALALGLFVVSERAEAPRAFADVCLAASALSLTLGHAAMVAPRRALDAGPRSRSWLTSALALTLVAPVAWLLLPEIGAHPFAQLGALVLFALTVDVVRSALSKVVRFVLSPARGVLLDAVSEARAAIAGAFDIEQLAVRVLKPLRRAAGLPEAAPTLYLIAPAREVRLDAAGHARSTARPMPSALARHFEHAGLVPIVRDDLAQRLVRRPELRELMSVLDQAQALVVLPLVVDGELEGALLVARGLRRGALSLEELSALESLSNEMSASIAVFSALERAQLRVQDAAIRERNVSIRLADTEDALLGLSVRHKLLEAAQRASAVEPPIAYSPGMRALLERLSEVAPHDLPLSLIGEVGTPLLPLAALLHSQSGRANAPFVVGDCAALDEPAVRRALLGERNEAGSVPGWLELAGEGTLVLQDLVALPLSLQLELAKAISEHRATRGRAGAVSNETSYDVRARLIVTLRSAPVDLVAMGAMSPELSRWLEPTAYRVPPLRERVEDLESLILTAVDRAARIYGRSVPGLTNEVLKVLTEHTWPSNEQELESVIARAVVACRGPRITLSDLPPLLAHREPNAGSFVEQEREILRRALERAAGNRTRAARALGLKRTTLIDKLRRLGLDDTGPETKH